MKMPPTLADALRLRPDTFEGAALNAAIMIAFGIICTTNIISDFYGPSNVCGFIVLAIGVMNAIRAAYAY